MKIPNLTLTVRETGTIEYNSTISSPESVFSILKPKFSHVQESFFLIPLNSQHVPLGILELFRGLPDGCQVSTAVIFRALIAQPMATCFIIAHNHPSGDLSPSKDDINLTKKVAEAGKLMDIKLLDHIIFSNSNFKSLNEEGYIQ